jgi:spermidine synthase
MAALSKWLSWFWPQKIHVLEGEISPVLEVTYENGKKVLNAGRVNYSFGALHEVFRFAFAEARVRELGPKEVLILGFGAGSIASILTDEYKLECRITGVEADSKVIMVAKNEFQLDRYKSLELVHAKAEEFVFETKKKFDLIAVDVFVEETVPASCQTKEFLEQLSSLLTTGGKAVFNIMPKLGMDGKDEFEDRFFYAFSYVQKRELQFGAAPNHIYIGKKPVV